MEKKGPQNPDANMLREELARIEAASQGTIDPHVQKIVEAQKRVLSVTLHHIEGRENKPCEVCRGIGHNYDAKSVQNVTCGKCGGIGRITVSKKK